MEFNKQDLDNYITGHYGEDQFKHGQDDEEIPCLYCNDDPPVVGGVFCSRACQIAYNADKARWSVKGDV